jgi:hypothetical protein
VIAQGLELFLITCIIITGATVRLEHNAAAGAQELLQGHTVAQKFFVLAISNSACNESAGNDV